MQRLSDHQFMATCHVGSASMSSNLSKSQHFIWALKAIPFNQCTLFWFFSSCFRLQCRKSIELLQEVPPTPKRNEASNIRLPRDLFPGLHQGRPLPITAPPWRRRSRAAPSWKGHRHRYVLLCFTGSGECGWKSDTTWYYSRKSKKGITKKY